MDTLKVKYLHMASEVLQQYRDLSLRDNKLFYYGYAKLDMQLMAKMKSENKESIEECNSIDAEDLTISISYEEIKELLGVARLQSRDLNSLINNLTRKSSFSITASNGDKAVLYIYDKILIENSNDRLLITFNDNALELFKIIKKLGNSYVDIQISDMMALESKYEINLYLYCLTLLRGNKGTITMTIDNLRTILAGEESLINDLSFVTRFINKPSKSISDRKTINMKITPTKDKNNINIKVERLKKEEEKKSSAKRKEEEPF